MNLHETEAKHEELLISQEVIAQESLKAKDAEEWEEPEFATVTRKIEGSLSTAVRKRLSVAVDIPVLVTETASQVHLSDISSEMDYKMVVECGEHKKEFNTENPAYNFQALLNWLDEEPGS